jgi:endoglucanase
VKTFEPQPILMCNIRLHYFSYFFNSNSPASRGFAKSLWLSLGMVFLLSLSQTALAQYVHRSGKTIVDGNNQEIILRGMGLGGWMLQEGYMLETSSFANPQHQIRAKIEQLIGTANTNEFYEKWLTNFCTKRDIDSLAAWGFNSVRLPMHYNLYTLPIEQETVPGQQTWLTKGFALTDSLIKWCAANSMYVILDLHAAPGGQGRDAAISDYDTSKPSLWESEANKTKTIALWKKLAERYKDEKWVAGYDLLNETNWNFTPGGNPNGCSETSNAPLKKLLQDITTAIREVDSNHLIFIEGNCWANNHNGLFPAWDQNMAISFHKYWSLNDIGSIQGVINLRNTYDLPLWMGEAGENSNVWFSGAIELLEKNKIGWAWWPLKKVNSVVNPLTIVKNDGYNTLLNYWKGSGTQPTVAFAKAALMELAENLKIEKNIYRKDVIDAMFRQINDRTTRPFKNHVVPGVVHLSDFDLGRHNVAYSDSDTATQHVSTGGSFTSWNNGWTYRNDAVDLETNNDADPNANGMNVGWTADKEWLQYTVNADSSAAYEVILRYAGGSVGKIKLSVDGVDQTQIIELPSGSGWQNKTISDVIIEKGTRRVKLEFIKAGINVSFLKFALSKTIQNTSFKGTTATTSSDGTWIYLTVNQPVNNATVSSSTDFQLTANNNPLALSEVTVVDEHHIGLKVNGTYNDGETVLLSYNGTAIQSQNGKALEAFTNLAVTNNLPRHIALPAQVEAEAFDVNQGLQLENTSDTGGGQNVGYTNTGDYLDYRIRVGEAGEFKVEVRVASAGQAGILEIQQLDENKSVLQSITIDMPVTGGWQTWTTVSKKMNLNAGKGWLRLKINKPEFNINWVKFTATIISGTEKLKHGSLNVYPNPVGDYLKVEAPENYQPVRDSDLFITSITGQIVKHFGKINLLRSSSFFVGDLYAGMYVVQLYADGKVLTNKLFKR